MAGREEYIVPIDIRIGPRGGLTYNGKGLNGGLEKAVRKELEKIERIEGTVQIVSVPVDAKYLSTKKQGQALGDYLEFIIYDKLIKKFRKENANVTAVEREEARFRALVARAKLTSKEQTIFRQETHAAADLAVNALWDYLELTEKDLKEKIEVEWIGSDDAVGDVSLKIGEKRIMVECKNYSDYFLEKVKGGFIQYFRLSDAEGHFPSPFWKFLKDRGGRFYDVLDPYLAPAWVYTVLTEGFTEYSKEISEGTSTTYGGDGGELLSYLLQKGSKASLEVNQRAIITLDRIKEYGKHSYKVFFNADLQKLDEPSKNKIAMETHLAKIVLSINSSEGKKQDIGKFTIPKESQSVILNNALGRAGGDPSKDGPGWTTNFNFVINKTLLNQIQ